MSAPEPSPGGLPRDPAADPPSAADAPRSWLASRVVLIAIFFALLAAPVARIGDPTSPAYEALEDATSARPSNGASEPSPLDFAVLGNSRAHVGLSPRRLSEGFAAAGLSDRRGWNFAVDGTDSMHHASFALHGLLAEPHPPRLIVWAVDPLMFDASRKANRLEQLRAGDVPLLVRARAPLELVLDVASMQAFPPYRHRPLVLAKVEDKTESMGQRLTRVQRLAGLVTIERPKPRDYQHFDDGFEPFVVLADWEFRFYQRHAVHYAAEYEALVLSDWHERFSRSFLAAAKDEGVVVVLLEMPISPYYREHFAGGAKHQAWRARMQRLADSEGALFLSDADRYSSDHDFGDPGHLPKSTAEEYSRALGERLGRDPRIAAALAAGVQKGR
jgi:hypothetical protein